MSEEFKDDVKNAVLTENTAQAVYKHLRELESNRAHVVSRWVWELLQNARDASPGDGQLVTSFQRGRNTITFFHNGRGFQKEEVAHLIYHGSTKSDDASLGQFGSGFLTTHLLSPKIAVAGMLEDGRWFEFELERKLVSPHTLRQCMDAAWSSFAPSDAPPADPLPKEFSTRFRYPIEDDGAADVVTAGVRTLKRCAPLVLAFNPQFARVRIEEVACATDFAVAHRHRFANTRVESVTIVKLEEPGGKKAEEQYLLIEGECTTIALRTIEADAERKRCIPQEGPRLYLGFPLVGTDQFSLPAVANSFSFGPTESRDGIYLGQADDRTNAVNQQVVKEALSLHVELIHFAAIDGYVHSAALATVPPVKEQTWLNVRWLRCAIQNSLIEPIRKTPSVVTVQGQTLAPREAILPCADETNQVHELWDLLNGIEHTSMLLPSQEEACAWSIAAKSWKDLVGEDVSFEEAWSGRMLAEYISDMSGAANGKCGRLDDLGNLLVDKKLPIRWLNRFCDFFRRNDIEALRTLNLVPSQAGHLDRLTNLRRDVGIDDELKGIADDLLDMRLREELRDSRVTSLEDEEGKGDYRNSDVAERIIGELRRLAKEGETGMDVVRDASNRFLAWMVRNAQPVDYFPVWSEANEGKAELIWLKKGTTEEGQQPLAPIQAWPTKLQTFADLFPRNRILAASYFECLPTVEHWKFLEGHGLLKTDVVLRQRKRHNFQESLPDNSLTEGEDHMSTSDIEFVDVAYFVKDRIGVMARVRDSRKRAILLWRFLTEYLIAEDATSVEAVEAKCECGESHSYYGAAWLAPVARNRWIPMGENKHSRAVAQPLARMLADDDSVGVLGNDHARRLLLALGVTQLELMMESLADSDGQRHRLDAESRWNTDNYGRRSHAGQGVC